MNLADFLAGISFRFVSPRTPPGEGGWYVVTRKDGSRARLFSVPGAPLDFFNVVLPHDEARIRKVLRNACLIPRMSTFTVGAIVNQAVAQMPPGHAFVNVGVWNGFTLLCGMADNPDRTCIGIDNFSQFGGPRDAFLARFNSRRMPKHVFHDLDYAEYLAQVHRGLIGCYIYDGEHSYASQLKGLQAAEPFFADDCIVLVDDTNWMEPWQATIDFVAQSPNAYRLLLDQTTCRNGHPSFWNGVMLWQRAGRKPSGWPEMVASTAARRPEAAEPPPPAVGWRDAIAPEQRQHAAKVSVVIAHCEAAADLETAIASARNLTYPDVELLVVDNTASDRASEIIAGHAQTVVAIRLKGRAGLSTAFQAGLDASHGEWVCLVDSAQRFVPTSVEIGLNFSRDPLGRMHADAEWYDRTARTLLELTRAVARDETAILVDDLQLGLNGAIAGRRLLPFLERDGQYNGQPADDATALRELARMGRAGAQYIAFAWPAFWWLDCYPGFKRHLRETCRCVSCSPQAIIFDLRQGPAKD